ncbi:MAG TPA: LLM class flavin-dependent oxidoreductase [Pseudolysinimonas sp.]|nr:LLM class flavin-dependent oxidoreductase [Pseudolysinimonas sp.]
MAKREAVLSVIYDVWGGMHPGAWRTPDAPADPLDFERIKHIVQTAERGKFHTLFLADTLGQVMERDLDILALTANAARWEPLMLCAALAQYTEHIGLAITASTTYSEPFNVARMFASLDHLSGGRASWNIVGSTGEAAENFNGYELQRDERYERAEEFYNVVTKLWDSYEDDAFLRNKESGQFVDPAKQHAIDHVGKFFQVKGPLNHVRPIQGYPVIAQAGASPAGLAFATKVADLMFAYRMPIEPAKQFYAEAKAMASDAGRNPDDMKIIPSLTFVMGHTRAEADDRMAEIEGLADPRIGIERLKGLIDFDLNPYPLDGPVPYVPPTEQFSKTMQDYYLGMARDQNMTVRELATYAVRWEAESHTPESMADLIEEYIVADAADGFNLNLADAAGSLEIFVDEVVPELQRRGLFHTEYQGTTLRESLGIPRPKNQFAAK